MAEDVQELTRDEAAQVGGGLDVPDVLDYTIRVLTYVGSLLR